MKQTIILVSLCCMVFSTKANSLAEKHNANLREDCGGVDFWQGGVEITDKVLQDISSCKYVHKDGKEFAPIWAHCEKPHTMKLTRDMARCAVIENLKLYGLDFSAESNGVVCVSKYNIEDRPIVLHDDDEVRKELIGKAVHKVNVIGDNVDRWFAFSVLADITHTAIVPDVICTQGKIDYKFEGDTKEVARKLLELLAPKGEVEIRKVNDWLCVVVAVRKRQEIVRERLEKKKMIYAR